MRYDTPIFFQKRTEGEYDKNTGNYGPDVIEETKRYASVSDCSIETLQIIYGDIKQGAVKIQIQNHYDMPFDSIRINDSVYAVDFQRKLRTKHTFIAHEVQ